MLQTVAYVSFQELATRVSHRNTGKACGDPIADRMLARIAADENLHMIFYRNLVNAAFDRAPDDTMVAVLQEVKDFQMPGSDMKNFRRASVLMAKAGIYDLRQHHDDVIMPVLRQWKVFERTGFGPEGEAARDELSAVLTALDAAATRFEESRDRALARAAARR